MNQFVNKISAIKSELSPICQSARSQFYAYLDGDVDFQRRDQIARHIESCLSCQKELDACRLSESALSSAVHAIPPAGDLRPEFYNRLAESRRKRAGWPVWQTAVPAFAACLLALFFFKTGIVNFTKPPLRNAVESPHGTPVHPNINDSEQHSDAVTGNSDKANGKGLSAVSQPEKDSTTVLQPSASGGGHRQINRDIATASDIPASHSHSGQIRHRKSIQVAMNLRPAIDSGNEITVMSPRNNDRYFGYQVGELSKKVKSNRGYGVKLAAADMPAKSGATLGLAMLTNSTDLHISDDNRGFMSSTHLETDPQTPLQGNKLEKQKEHTLAVDADTNTSTPAELPALP